MLKILNNILIFFVAVFLMLTIGVYGLVYAFVTRLFKTDSWTNYWGDLLYSVNVAIDQVGNVMLSAFLNDHAVKDHLIYPFGNVTHTISHVLAVNHIKYQNLTRFGKIIIDLLEELDPGHTIDSL